jgi:hypothetical protein
MIHKHHEWLTDVNESIVRDYEREQEMARTKGRTQETGHVVESLWDGVLTDWLPPQYEVDKRKYILLENEDGTTLPKETDLLVYHPHYPEKLRKKNYILASGIAAAFSVRRTVGRKDIEDAYKEGIALRRGMKIRDATIKAHLIPPVFFGLLGESHDWKAPSSTPKDNMKAITNEFDRDFVLSPREGLDLICVADLGTWSRIAAVLPERFLLDQLRVNPLFSIFTNQYGTESLVMSGMRHDYNEKQNLSPLTNFIGSLWGKLAINDQSLKPLADGFRITETVNISGSFGMGQGPYKLSIAATPAIASRYRNSDPWAY